MKAASTRTMVTFVIGDGDDITVPDWVADIHAFRRWLDDVSLPERLCAWWIGGVVLIEMSKEQIFTHVLVKSEVTFVLTGLAKQLKLGHFFTDGILLSNFEADISGNPDGLFLTYETRGSERVRLIEGKEGGYTEMQGSPDMVLEVLSRSSVNKDEVLLKEKYWKADIPEYWLVDARGDSPRLDIFRHAAKGYVATRKQAGWVKSRLFGKEFRLVVETGPKGDPEYNLEVR